MADRLTETLKPALILGAVLAELDRPAKPSLGALMLDEGRIYVNVATAPSRSTELDVRFDVFLAHEPD